MVTISSTKIQDISRRIDEILRKNKRRENEKIKQLRERRQLLYVHEELRLGALLDAFYQQHQMIDDSRLITPRYENGPPVLQSYGGYDQKSREPEERAEKLAKYQQEMRDFTAFLKQGYFEGTL